MFTLIAKKEDVITEYPKSKDWLNIMSESFGKDINSADLEMYYTYGYFIKESKDENYYISLYSRVAEMLFDERYEFELSKVRVNLTIRLGSFIISDRLEKGFVPENIKTIVKELTKVKMMVEYEFYKNEDVMKSIPEIDNNILSFEIIREVISDDYSSDEHDLDELLDKISKSGMDSLSKDEIEFLDKKSKDI